MKDRLFYVRKTVLGLSRAKFGEPIGMTNSEIKNIEYGLTTLKEAKLKALCKAHGINEQWLRTGVGDPRPTLTKQEQIAKILASAICGNSYQDRFIRAVCLLPQEAYPALAAWIIKAAEELKEEFTEEKNEAE